MATKKIIHVDIISDTVCPWCYIGKRRFEKAVAIAKEELDVDFEVKWWPFLLDPTLPKEGVDKQARYKAKFGEERMKQIMPYVTQTAAKEGINMSFGGKIGSTFDSHRLITLAGAQGKQDEVVNALFKYYFEEEKNIADSQVLLAAADEAGVTGAKEMLASDDLAAEVKGDLGKWNISGVPFFVINKKYSVSGAQEPEGFLDLFYKAAQ